MIPFNKPHMTGKELGYIADAYAGNMLAGDGPFTGKCHNWLEKKTGANKALLTHSCTAALEMAAILLNIQPGDEVIMPSYTFVSTANAFALRGGIPVFIDIRDDTLNLNENLIEAAITSKTRAIVVVHYAGVACDMDTIMSIALRHELFVVEDAAQGIMASYKGAALGSIGDLGTYSFHETKNLTSGEGGSLLVNDSQLILRAEIIREKGTNRSQFHRGIVDKYTWQDLGSSFLPGELIAAFLWAQFEEAELITLDRLKSWQYYHDSLLHMESRGFLRRPIVPKECEHNAHMYYVIVNDSSHRNELIKNMAKVNINAVFHYIPLHTSPAGKLLGIHHGELPVTDQLCQRIIRLPLWTGISKAEIDQVVSNIERFFINIS